MRAPSRWFAVCALLAALALACRDEDLDPAPTPRPRAGTEAAASPTSPPAAGTPKAPVNLPASPERVPPRTRTPEPADPSVLREPAPFPTDLAVVVATWSCWQCEGGPTSIVRIYRDPQGELRTETLLAMRGGRRLGANYLWRVIADNRSGIAVSECLGPECLATFSGVSYSQPGRSVEVRRSVDGGVTWSAEPVEPGKGGLLALFAGDEVVLWEATPTGSPPYTTRFFLHPSGRELTPPSEGEFPFPVAVRPCFGEPGTAAPPECELPAMLWQVQRPPGSELSELVWPTTPRGGPPVPTTLPELQRAARNETNVWFLQWYEGGQGRWGVGLGESPEPLRRYALEGLTGRQGGAWVLGDGSEHYVTTLTLPRDRAEPPFRVQWPLVLARLDPRDGEVQPYVATELEGVQLAYVLLAYDGPFARAIPGDACIEVYRSPSAQSEVVECVANGVLLQRTAPPTVDGAWLGVSTPRGLEGWAETRHLEW